jgi:hypothetical protein
VIGDAELPGVGQEYGNDVPRHYARRNQAARHALDCVPIFGVRELAVAGCIDERGFLRMVAAGVEDYVVQEEILRISVELRAKHASAILAEIWGTSMNWFRKQRHQLQVDVRLLSVLQTNS